MPVLNAENKKRVVVIGGGTGSFTVLSGLRSYPLSLSAIVSMADDGGSTGILRDELGVLPPGDVRQCLVALSDSSHLLRNLMNYRFENGGLGGHNFGNLLLSALEKVTGSFESAVEEVGRILAIQGKVIPVTTHGVRLRMVLNNGKTLEGEKEVYLSEEIDGGYKHLHLHPTPDVNPAAIEEILRADLIVLGPGGFYTSIIPNLLVKGVIDALISTNAKKLFVVNLMNRRGQTTGFKVSSYLKELEKFIGKDLFDYILINEQKPSKPLMKVYASEGDLVTCDLQDKRIISAPLLGERAQGKKVDLMQRSLIRHDAEKLAEEIVRIVSHL